MMRSMISAVAVVAAIVVATSVLRSRSPSISTAAMPPLRELQMMASVNKLPIQEVEDQSLVYPTVARR
jgi:hypothetical protein